MLPKFIGWSGVGRTSKKPSAHHANRRLGFEPCEDRRLLAVVAGSVGSSLVAPPEPVTPAVVSAAPQQTHGGSASAPVTVAPVLTQPANATAAVGTPFSDQIVATGTPAPTFSLTSGPAGMKINSTSGLISWTPTLSETGTVNVTVAAKNSAGTATANFSILVPVVTAPTIAKPANATATVGNLFTDSMTATGIPAPTFSLGNAPSGMTIDPNSGLISWTPTVNQTGTLNVSVTAKNPYGSASTSFSIAVPAVKSPSITQPANATAIIGVPFSDQIVATGAPAPTFALATAPVGMTINSTTGLISWTAVAGQLGAQTVKVTATNVAGSSSRTFTVTVPNTAPVITQPANATDLVGVPFTTTIVAKGTPAPTFSLTTAPSDMSINSASGVIIWTPGATEYGTINVTVAATNASGTATSSFTIAVPNPAPVFTTGTTLPPAYDGFAYTTTIAATQTVAPGTPAPTYSVVSGPAGLTIDPNSGAITWTPTAAQNGTQTVVIAATNFAGTTQQSFTIVTAVDTIPPSVPSLSVGTITTTNSIPLSWTPATDTIAGVAGYEIYSYTPALYRGHSGRGGGITLVHPAYYTLLVDNIPANQTSYTMDGLAPSTTYQYAVEAVDFAGNESGYSNVVSGTTLLAPSITYYSNTTSATNPPLSIVANHQLYFTLSAGGSPAPTLSLVSAPAGVVFNPGAITNSQLTFVVPNITWTPTASQVGSGDIIMQATNSVGSYTLDIPVTVIADVPIPSLSVNGGLTYSLGNYTASTSTPFSYQLGLNPGFNSSGSSPQYATSGVPFSFQMSSTTNTSPTTYSLVSAPAGMTLDPNTGLGTWAPGKADAGPTSVTVASTNSAGTSLLTFTFPTYFTGAPGPVAIDYFTSTPSTASAAPTITPTAVWTPPADTTGIAGYQVTATAALSGVVTTFNSPGLGTSIAMPGLNAGQYFVTVAAYDANGNPGLSNTPSGNYGSMYTGIVPSVNWSFNSPNAIVGSPVAIQFQSNNGYVLTYSILSGPAGATINPTTGLLTWTPTDAQAGPATLVVNATAGWGNLVMTLNFPVYVADAPVVAVTTGTDPTSGLPTVTATWTPPILDLNNVAGYQLTIVDANAAAGTPPTVLVVPAANLSQSLSDLGITSGSIEVAAVDAAGNVGLSSALVGF